MTLGRRTVGRGLAAFAGWIGGCGKLGPDADPRPEAATPQVTPPPDPPAIPAAPLYERTLAWLDPDATSAAYLRGLPVDPGALSLLFAVPPRPERLIRDLVAVVADLEAVFDPELPSPRTFLGPQALAMTPVVSTGTYVAKPLVAPRADVETLLGRAKMERLEIEGFAVYHPSGAFPWKIAFVSDDLVVFIPSKEIGHGLGPLTAARDLPPSDLRRELLRSVADDDTLLLDFVAQGPFLHLDLGQDVMAVRLRVRSWKDGLDVTVRLQVAEDVETSRKALQDRRVPLETERMQALVERVAFSVDGNVIEGRLQLVEGDLAALRGGL